jgi:hypothetical protein
MFSAMQFNLRVQSGGLWALVLVLLAGCSTSRHGDVAQSSSNALPEPYVRVVRPATNVVQLQISIRKFVPPGRRQPAVWLASAVHLGERDYYRALQEHLDAQTLVLYEGIDAGDADTGNAPPEDRASSSATLQARLAQALGLAFQLDAIDYERANFRPSDLNVQELRALMAGAAPAEDKQRADQTFESLVEIMEGGSLLSPLLNTGLSLIGASPRFQALSKFALIEMIGELQGDLSQLQGLPPHLAHLLDVLIQKRNEKVLADLKSAVTKLGSRDSISVFYGTGHMGDLEQRLRKELNYRPAEQLWLTALEVDFGQAGVSEAEAALLRDLVRGQLKSLQSHE